MSIEQHSAVTDTAGAVKENLGEWILHHTQNSNAWHPVPVVDLHLPQFEPINLFGISINLSITNHVVMLWIAGLILVVLFLLAYNPKKKVPRGFGNVLEMLVIFVRDEIAIANMGEEEGRRFTPLLVTYFFFVLISNLMGLIPLFSTSTSNINVTAGLALVTFGATQVYGISKNGLIGYYKNLVPHGVPWYLWLLMFIIELMGLIAKHVALTIRLFANMTAGHIVLFALLGLIIVFKSYLVAFVSVPFGVFVYFLEILVALIQAYIFTILSALFIGMSIKQEH